MTSRKLFRIKVTPDLHLTYSKNAGNLGLVLKMKNIACLSILLTKHVKDTYLYLFKFVLYSIVAFKRINKLNGHKSLYNDNLRKLPNEYGDVSVMINKKWPRDDISNSTIWSYQSTFGLEIQERRPSFHSAPNS